MHPPALARHDVHVWMGDLDVPAQAASAWRTVLSLDEQARAARFRSNLHRARFEAAHGLVRLVLAGYLGTNPGALKFSYGRFGKPALAEPFDRYGVRFNLSHCDRIALVGIALNRDVGIDVERMDPDVPVHDLARRWFSRAECDAVREESIDRQRLAFFRTWTRKEAYLKARGIGLSRSPPTFDVPTGADPGSGEVADPNDASQEHWRCDDLTLGPEWVAAVVAAGSDWRIRRLRWPQFLGAPEPCAPALGRPRARADA